MSLIEKSDAADHLKQITRLEWSNLALMILGSLLGFCFWKSSIGFSFFLGGLVTVVNLRLLRWIVGGLSQETVNKTKLIAQILLNFFGIFGAVGFIVMYLKVDAIALLAGFSTVIVAIFLEGIQGLFRRTEAC